jgi:hypothetical protein
MPHGRSQSESSPLGKKEFFQDGRIVVVEAGTSKSVIYPKPLLSNQLLEIRQFRPMILKPKTKPVRALARPHRASPDMPEHADTIEAGTSIVASRSRPVKETTTSAWELSTAPYYLLIDI